MKKDTDSEMPDDMAEATIRWADEFGQLISDACTRFADQLEHEGDKGVFSLAVEMGAMKFAAVCAHANKQSEDDLVQLARAEYHAVQEKPHTQGLLG